MCTKNLLVNVGSVAMIHIVHMNVISMVTALCSLIEPRVH